MRVTRSAAGLNYVGYSFDALSILSLNNTLLMPADNSLLLVPPTDLKAIRDAGYWAMPHDSSTLADFWRRLAYPGFRNHNNSSRRRVYLDLNKVRPQSADLPMLTGSTLQLYYAHELRVGSTVATRSEAFSLNAKRRQAGESTLGLMDTETRLVSSSLIIGTANRVAAFCLLMAEVISNYGVGNLVASTYVSHLLDASLLQLTASDRWNIEE